jgi:hypothetical protein
MNSPSPSSFNWQLWRLWVLVCSATAFIRVTFDLISSSASSAIGNTSIITILIFTATSGALGGMAQYYVLRRWISTAKYWVLATSLGSALGLAVNNFIHELDIATLPQSDANNFLALFAGSAGRIPLVIFDIISGLILGLAQWLVLRGKVPQAGWWVLASSFGMLFNGVAVNVMRQIFGRMGLYSGAAYDPLNWVIAIISGAIYGAITGILLVRLLQKTQ